MGGSVSRSLIRGLFKHMRLSKDDTDSWCLCNTKLDSITSGWFWNRRLAAFLVVLDGLSDKTLAMFVVHALL